MNPSLRLCVSASLLIFAMLGATPSAAQTIGPVWAKSDLFWYRKAVPGGNRWMQVDAGTGSNVQLFDHTRLASDLSAKLETRITPFALPFVSRDAHFVVKFDGSNSAIQSGAMALEFVYRGELWRCDMEVEWDWGRASDYDCNSRGAFDRVEEPLSDTAPRVSPDGKWEALIESNDVVIRRVGTAALTVLSTDGTPTFGYHAGSIQWSADSKTVSAYRVNAAIWTAANVGSSVRQYLARAEWSVR